jgi:hypothetical protein
VVNFSVAATWRPAHQIAKEELFYLWLGEYLADIASVRRLIRRSIGPSNIGIQQDRKAPEERSDLRSIWAERLAV